VSGSSVLRVAIDNTTNKKVWLSLDGGSWNGSGTADPATNVGGIDTSSLADIFACNAVWSPTGASACTANFGASAWVYTPPSGFTGILA
jgi:hypothetical protein